MHIKTFVASIVLVTYIFLLGNISSFVSASEIYDGRELIIALSIMPNDFNGSETATRGEYVTYITGLLNAGSWLIHPDTDVFNDVTVEHQYAREIATAKECGIIQGINGNFRPDDKISFNDAVVILIRALGYGRFAEYSGGYPSGYFSEANRLGIFKGIQKTSGFLTKSEASRLLFNALETNIVSTYSYLGVTKSSVEKDTVLSAYFNINIITGVVTTASNSSLNLFDAYKLKETELRISGVIYSMEMLGIKTIDFLGHNVRAYYRENGMENEIIHIETYRSDVITVDFDDLVSVEKNRIKCYQENENMQILDVSNTADILYNGKAVSDSLEENLVIIEETNYGFVRLIDNDFDGIYDVVFITEYRNYEVVSIDYEKIVIYAKQGNLALDFSDVHSLTIISNNEHVDFNNILQKSIITVSASKDFQNVIVYVSNETVAGVIEEIQDDNIVVIDGEEYKVDSCFANEFNKFKPGDSINALIDVNGRIAGNGDASSVNKNEYGYVCGVDKLSSLSKNIKMRILDIHGESHIYEIDDKVEMDGKKVCGNDVFTRFTYYNVDTGKYYSKNEIVRYSLKNDGLTIKNIDTIDEGLGGYFDSLKVKMFDYVEIRPYPSATNISYMSVDGLSGACVKDAVVFYVPRVNYGGSASGNFDIKDYFVANWGDFNNLNSFYRLNKTICLVDPDEAGFSEIAVLYQEDDYERYGVSINAQLTVPFMVQRITTTYDEYENEVPNLYLMNEFEQMSIKALNYDIIQKPVYGKDGIATGDFRPLKAGDIIQIVVRPDGIVSEIILLFDSERLDNGIFRNGTTYNGLQIFECGFVYARTGNGIKVLSTVKPDALPYSETPVSDVFDFNRASAVKTRNHCTVYDSKSNTVYKGGFGDIVDYASNNAKPSKIIFSRFHDTTDAALFVIN